MCDRPEIVLEMIIVRITYASGLPDLADIINGKGKIEKKIPDTPLFDMKAKEEAPLKKDSGATKVPEDTSAAGSSLMEEALKMFPDAIVQ